MTTEAEEDAIFKPARRERNGVYNASPVWSRDGKKIGFTYSIERGDLWLMDGDGRNIVALSKHAAGRDPICNWSPDGKKIAFITERGEDGSYAGIMTANGKELFFVAKAYNADWHVDGKHLLIEAMGTKEDKLNGSDVIAHHLYEIDIESRKRRQITFGKYYDTNPSYSPNGKWIVFNSRQRGREAQAGSSIYLIRRDGTGLFCLPLHDSPEENWQYSAPAFSSDGKRIVFARGRYAPTDLYTCNLDGSDLHRITNFYSVLPPLPKVSQK